MIDIIPRVDRALLIGELNDLTFLRHTNKGGNELYVVKAGNAPQTLREIGRLREHTFRASGGGTGKELDLDEYDSGPMAYSQLIVWDPEEEEIVAGYRFIRCADAYDSAEGRYHLATEHLFAFSDSFKRHYLPHTIELGRSFVQPAYQADSRKGLFSLDNLWDGLGALTVVYPEVRYLFGKVTMYTTFNKEARDGILWFMNHYFPDKEALMMPHKPLALHQFPGELAAEIGDLPYKEGHRILNRYVRERGENIPPLVNSYMNLSATMCSFGTAMNHSFGEVEETAIMVTIQDVYPEKKSRHVDTFERDKHFYNRP
jgi:hypothetical protein